MLFGKTKKIVEDKEAELKLNLSNNYKDAAYKSFQEFISIIKDLRNDGKISDKDFEKLSSRVEEYKRKFRNYIN
ncbi:MAG: hypothetical protein HFI34_10935 [Lachnospiraceae bacterium]|nr:hypothetical protein [Lachnospiraceae bacterium]